MRVIPPSVRGIRIALEENIPLGDGILIATAKENNIQVIVSNDDHIRKTAPKYGLSTYNPIPKHIREKIR